MADHITRRWWDRVSQIRNEADQRNTFHETQALAMEQAVSELYSDACSPWFDERSFVKGKADG